MIVIDENYELFVQKTNLNISNQNSQITATRIYNKLPTALKGVENVKKNFTRSKQMLKEEFSTMFVANLNK